MKSLKFRISIFSLFIISLIFSPGCKQMESVKGKEISETEKSVMNKEELEGRVNKLLRDGDNVTLRRNVEDVFTLGDLYAGEGDIEKAINLYTEALKVDAWRFEYQLKLANLFIKRKEIKQATEIAKLVYEQAEEEALITGAEDLIRKYDVNLLKILKDRETSLGQKYIDETVGIVIVPIGNINKKLLSELAQNLEQHMGIKFTVSKNDIDPGKMDRSYAVKYVDDVYKNIEPYLTQVNVTSLLVKLRRINADTHEGKIELIRTFLKNVPQNNEELEFFEKNLRELESKGQYDVDRLISNLSYSYPINKNSKIKGYLGITELDLFAKNSNFLFAGAVDNYGVVSYARFKGSFNEEKQSRPRLLERSLKQAISSTLFVLGIPRCTNPTCVHGYPHNLSEHDLKGIEMCSLCRERLNNAMK